MSKNGIDFKGAVKPDPEEIKKNMEDAMSGKQKVEDKKPEVVDEEPEKKPPKEEDKKPEAEAVKPEEDKKPEASGELKPEIDDEKVLKYLSEKRGKEFKALDDVFQVETKEVIKEIPQEIDDEEVASFAKFKKETQGTFADYQKLQKDWKAEDPVRVAREYLRIQNPEFTSEEINEELADTYKVGVDPEDLEESDIKRASRNFKKLVQEGVKYFESTKDQFRVSIQKKPDETAQLIEQTQKFWSDGVSKAVEELNDIDFGEFNLKITEKESLIKNYSSVESILNQFRNEDGSYNFSRLIKTIEAGKRRSEVLGVFKDGIETGIREDVMKSLKNHGDQDIRIADTDNTSKKLSAAEQKKLDGMVWGM